MPGKTQEESAHQHLARKHERYAADHPARQLIRDPAFVSRLNEMIDEVGGDPEDYDGKLIRDLLTTSLKLQMDGRDTGELKLLASSLKELRHSYRVFADHPDQFSFG